MQTVGIYESRVAQWKRAGPITQRSEDRNLALLCIFPSILPLLQVAIRFCMVDTFVILSKHVNSLFFFLGAFLGK